MQNKYTKILVPIFCTLLSLPALAFDQLIKGIELEPVNTGDASCNLRLYESQRTPEILYFIPQILISKTTDGNDLVQLMERGASNVFSLSLGIFLPSSHEIMQKVENSDENRVTGKLHYNGCNTKKLLDNVNDSRTRAGRPKVTDLRPVNLHYIKARLKLESGLDIGGGSYDREVSIGKEGETESIYFDGRDLQFEFSGLNCVQRKTLLDNIRSKRGGQVFDLELGISAHSSSKTKCEIKGKEFRANLEAELKKKIGTPLINLEADLKGSFQSLSSYLKLSCDVDSDQSEAQAEMVKSFYDSFAAMSAEKLKENLNQKTEESKKLDAEGLKVVLDVFDSQAQSGFEIRTQSQSKVAVVNVQVPYAHSSFPNQLEREMLLRSSDSEGDGIWIKPGEEISISFRGVSESEYQEKENDEPIRIMTVEDMNRDHQVLKRAFPLLNENWSALREEGDKSTRDENGDYKASTSSYAYLYEGFKFWSPSIASGLNYYSWGYRDVEGRYVKKSPLDFVPIEQLKDSVEISFDNFGRPLTLADLVSEGVQESLKDVLEIDKSEMSLGNIRIRVSGTGQNSQRVSLRNIEASQSGEMIKVQKRKYYQMKSIFNGAIIGWSEPHLDAEHAEYGSKEVPKTESTVHARIVKKGDICEDYDSRALEY